MLPPPTWSPSSRCEEIQLQPPEIWSPDPCQPHSHDFLTDAIVRKMSRMFCQAARGREVFAFPFGLLGWCRLLEATLRFKPKVASMIAQLSFG
jgi:hypothetical protein